MRRLTMILILLLTLPATVLAQESDPLAHSVLLADFVGWLMAGLAVLLMVLFILWARRSPR